MTSGASSKRLLFNQHCHLKTCNETPIAANYCLGRDFLASRMKSLRNYLCVFQRECWVFLPFNYERKCDQSCIIIMIHFVGCTSTVIAYVDPVQCNTGWQWHDWTKIALLLSFLQQTDRQRKTINTYFLSESVHWATPQGHPVGILWLFMCIFFTHYCNLVSWEKWIYPSLIQIKSHGNHS